MDRDEIRTVMVVGSGVMGRGIARSFASAGFRCLMLTRDPSRCDGLAEGIEPVGEPPAEPPDLVIEAIPERLDLKLALFRDLDARYDSRAILASNTSCLPLQAMADELSHPEAFCGLHYFQPADSFDFVELIEVAQTASWTVERVAGALARTGKAAIHLRQPVIGFLINRLQHAMLHEAYHLIEQGVVDAATVDRVARHLLGPRMSVTGLLMQKDLSGMETHALSQRAIVPHLHHGAEPSPLVQDMLARGDLGVASGRGFYDWRGRDVAAIRRRAADKLARILRIASEPDGG